MAAGDRFVGQVRQVERARREPREVDRQFTLQAAAFLQVDEAQSRLQHRWERNRAAIEAQWKGRDQRRKYPSTFLAWLEEGGEPSLRTLGKWLKPNRALSSTIDVAAFLRVHPEWSGRLMALGALRNLLAHRRQRLAGPTPKIGDADRFISCDSEFEDLHMSDKQAARLEEYVGEILVGVD